MACSPSGKHSVPQIATFGSPSPSNLNDWGAPHHPLTVNDWGALNHPLTVNDWGAGGMRSRYRSERGPPMSACLSSRSLWAVGQEEGQRKGHGAGHVRRWGKQPGMVRGMEKWREGVWKGAGRGQGEAEGEGQQGDKQGDSRGEHRWRSVQISVRSWSLNECLPVVTVKIISSPLHPSFSPCGSTEGGCRGNLDLS